LLSIAHLYPDKIRECFPFPDLLHKGVVIVKFWSQKDKKWRLIFTDDRLPARRNGDETYWFGISPAGTYKNELWINYLEKGNLQVVRYSKTAQDLVLIFLKQWPIR
jgi:hypothetical protein